MKNKKLLSRVASILKLDENALLTASENEAGDESIVNSFTEKYQVFEPSEVEKIKNNAKNEAVSEFFANPALDVVNDIPSIVYAKITRANLESKEKTIAKKYGIEDYKGLENLIDKLVAKSNDGKSNPDTELLSQIETLKQTLTEKEKEVEAVKQKYVQDEVVRVYETSILALPFNFDREKELDKLTVEQKKFKALFDSEFRLEKNGDTTVIVDLQGKRVNDKLGDPIKLNEFFTTFAKEKNFSLIEEDKGGRGGGSSQGGGEANIYKGKTFEETIQLHNKQNPDKQIGNPMSKEGVDLRMKWNAENKTN